MASPSPGKRRMDIDVLKLIESHYPITLLSGLHEFIVRFKGPEKTPYENGVWNVRVELPERYPYKSPSIGFMNRIFHPNIDEPSGSVCLDVINQTWTPLYDLLNIFDQFLPQLLLYPNPSDPLNGEAATMYLHSPESYEKRVKESVQKYATDEILEKQNEQYQWYYANGKEKPKTKTAGSSTLENGDDDVEFDEEHLQNSDDGAGALSDLSDEELEMEF